MIAKIVQGRGFRGVINYVLEKERAQLLQAEGIRLKDREAIIRSFITQSKLNPKITKPVAHISLDFSAQDKGRLTDDFIVKVAQEYLQKMGYSNTQYLIAHYDATLAEYIQALKARKLAAKSKIRIRRVLH